MRYKGRVLVSICSFVLLIIIIMGDEDTKTPIPDVTEFFPDVGEDLSKVTWAHAVNSKEKLDKYIADESIMMLEADILPGHLTDEDQSGPTIPIMAHPPDVESDVSFEMWIDAVIKSNEDGKKKGAKLDFKDISVVDECLKILQNRTKQITFPLWLNADILKGPVDADIEPLNADKFITLCVASFPLATLSLGWKTKYTTSDDEAAMYTKESVEEMSSLLEAKHVAQPVTFPIRAAFVSRSVEYLDWLVDNVPASSISIWSSSSDTVDIQALLSLRDLVGPDSVYYDLPEEQKKEFDEAKKAEDKAASSSYQILPNNASTWATVGIAIASAFAALYLYD